MVMHVALDAMDVGSNPALPILRLWVGSSVAEHSTVTGKTVVRFRTNPYWNMLRMGGKVFHCPHKSDKTGSIPVSAIFSYFIKR